MLILVAALETATLLPVDDDADSLTLCHQYLYADSKCMGNAIYCQFYLAHDLCLLFGAQLTFEGLARFFKLTDTSISNAGLRSS